MFVQGLVIMVVGVGMVVGFLSLLVFVLTLSAKIIPRFNHILPDDGPRKRATRVPAPKTRANPESDASDVEIAVAIAAVRAHQTSG